MTLPPFPSPTLVGLGYNWVRRPKGSTSVQRHVSAREGRSGYWAEPAYEWDLTFDVLRDFDRGAIPSELKRLQGFFLAAQGDLTGFPFDDTDDDRVTGQFVAVGNGSAILFTLVRTWGDAGYFGAVVTEPIGMLDTTVPFNVYLDGVLQPSGTYGYVDTAPVKQQLGFVTPPGAGVSITVDMGYFFWVRFKEGSLDFEKFAGAPGEAYWRVKKLTLVSVKAGVQSSRLPTPPPPPPPSPPPCACPGPNSSSAGGGWNSSILTPTTKTYSNLTHTAQVSASGLTGFPSYVFRSVEAHSAGRYYFELQTGGGQIGFRQVGLIDASYTVTGSSTQLGGVGSVGSGLFFVTGLDLFVNGVGSFQAGAGGSIGVNSWVGVAVDLDTRLIWFTNDGVRWNDPAASPTPDPTCEVNGTDISALPTADYFIAVCHAIQAFPGMPWTIVTAGNSSAGRGTVPRCYVWW